jgi:hypothetical protein
VGIYYFTPLSVAEWTSSVTKSSDRLATGPVHSSLDQPSRHRAWNVTQPSRNFSVQTFWPGTVPEQLASEISLPRHLRNAS